MYITSTPINTSHTSFKGLSPNVLKNQMRIYLCQDIFAEKLKVKIPETALEKEVLLEVLQHRLHLDRLTRLANEKLRLKTKLEEAVELVKNDPENPKLDTLRTELQKKGNLEAVFDTMNKNIEKERKIKKADVDYFDNISKLEEEYFKKHFISAAKVERFHSAVKNKNINKNGEYSTEQLINLVSGDTLKENIPEQKAVQKKANISINKNRFIELVSSSYEDFVRKNVDIYRGKSKSFKIIKPLADQHITEKFSEYFKKFPEVKKHLDRICRSLRLKFLSKIHTFEDVNIYNLERIFEELDTVMKRVKTLQKEVDELKLQAKENPDENLKKLLLNKEVELTKNKVEWQELMDTTVCAEEENRKRIRDAGHEKEYDYLVEKNETVLKFKELYKLLKQNNDMLPDEVWEKLINVKQG